MEVITISGIDLENDKGNPHSVRMRFIDKGFRENGVAVKNYSYSTDHTFLNCEERKSRGYLFKSYSKQNKLFTLLANFHNSFIFLIFLLRIPRSSILLIDTLPTNLIFPFFFVRIIKKNLVVAQYYEFFVFHTKPKSIFSRILMQLNFYFLKRLLRFIDILIVISDYHQGYFKKYLRKGSKVIVISMFLDFQENNTVNVIKCEDCFCICYAGTITESNGIELLIRASSQVSNISLSLYGFCTDEYKRKLGILAEQFFLNNESFFIHGPISNDEIVKILRSQNLLVIPKVLDNRSNGYIPSKLGDFLHSGVPVLCTDIAEMNNYIIDGINGFLVEADAQAMADKINKIRNTPTEELKNIGRNGKVTSKKFHYSFQVQNILDEIISVQK